MEKNLQLAEMVANVLDSRFKVAGVKFGLNAILELIPGIGDTIASGFSLYIIVLAIGMRVPGSILIPMLLNIALTFIVGIVPFLGDAFYILYKPNVRNVTLLKDYFETHKAQV